MKTRKAEGNVPIYGSDADGNEKIIGYKSQPTRKAQTEFTSNDENNATAVCEHCGYGLDHHASDFICYMKPKPIVATERRDMPKANHAPTPWYTNRCEKSTDHYIAANGHMMNRVGETRKAEDAAFIVRAVNSHEELIAQLKESQRRFLSLLGWLETPEKGPMEMIIKEGTAKIAQAIARAEGK